MANHELDQLIVTNPTNKPFTVKWAGVPHTLNSGQRIIWQRFLANHFAKHLANAILMGMEQKHKKDYLATGKSEREYIPKSYLNSREMRPKVIDSIITGVYQYYEGQNTDPNLIIQQQIDQMNQQPLPQEKALDLGEAADPLYGVLKDDLPVESEAPQLTVPLPGMPGQAQYSQPQPAAAPAMPPMPTQPQPGASMMPGGDMTPPPPPPAPAASPADTAPANTAAAGNEDGDGDNRSMKELRAEAAQNGVDVPFGTTKEALKELIKKQYA